MKNTYISVGGFTNYWDNFHFYVNGRFILGEMLIGKTYVNENFTFNENTLMGGFKYKGKERGEMFLGKSYANERLTLMGGFTVICRVNMRC